MFYNNLSTTDDLELCQVALKMAIAFFVFHFPMMNEDDDIF